MQIAPAAQPSALFAEAGDILELAEAKSLGFDPDAFPNDGDAGAESEG